MARESGEKGKLTLKCKRNHGVGSKEGLPGGTHISLGYPFWKKEEGVLGKRQNPGWSRCYILLAGQDVGLSSAGLNVTWAGSLQKKGKGKMDILWYESSTEVWRK